MARRHKKNTRKNRIRTILSTLLIVLVLLAGASAAWFAEFFMNETVENAGRQMTAHTNDGSAAQVFMNGQWYSQRNMETLLVMGIDESGSIGGSDSYNNSNQTDFLMLFVRDAQTGESSAIHLNRDTMTDITMLGVTGEATGTRYAQLALAYNYGQGGHDSSKNTAKAVSRLLYGMNIDHYIAVTMDAVPVMNDWAGGVEVEVLDDFTGVNEALVLGKKVTLSGEQALAYVRTRKGLEDSSNINRMERQRQYASAWVEKAQAKLKDSDAVAQLVTDMSDLHYSDCTAQELADFADMLDQNTSIPIYELPGEAVKGEQYMEFYADDAGIQKLVLDIFYAPVN